MNTELLEIQPHVLKFTFELKKQSACSIVLTNKTEQYVAFKVKTTSPRKYCVRPNSGVIKPKSSCSFTVTMQAQEVAPPEMQCKDKFLVQSTLVTFGTSEDEITSTIFAKESGYYIEEKKIRVSLVTVSPVQSSLYLPTDGQKQDPCLETLALRDRVHSGVENIAPPHTVSEDMEGLEAEMVSHGHLKETCEIESRHLVSLPIAGVVEEEQDEENPGGFSFALPIYGCSDQHDNWVLGQQLALTTTCRGSSSKTLVFLYVMM